MQNIAKIFFNVILLINCFASDKKHEQKQLSIEVPIAYLKDLKNSMQSNPFYAQENFSPLSENTNNSLLYFKKLSSYLKKILEQPKLTYHSPTTLAPLTRESNIFLLIKDKENHKLEEYIQYFLDAIENLQLFRKFNGHS